MSETSSDKNTKSQRPRRTKVSGMSPKGAINRVRVVKISFTNILLVVGSLFLALLLFNNYNQPSLGEEVEVSQFLNNVKDNKYAQVDIRNDGKAVGYGKSVDVVVGNAAETETKGAELTEVKSDKDLEEKNLSDLVAEFTEEDPIELLKEDLTSLFTGGDRIREIIVLEDKVIVDWDKKAKKDWIINDADEDKFVDAFSEKNLDIAKLNTPVSYLRSAGARVEADSFNAKLQNDRYRAVWTVGDNVYAKTTASNLVQNHVDFGTATADFTKFLQEEGINLSSQATDFAVQPISKIDFNMIVNIFLIGILGFLGFMLLRSINGANGGLMKFGQSKARMFFGQKMNITFKDVAGVDEAKEELKEVVDFLKNPGKYRKIGAKIPRGVLMVGQPGTGKTLMARAVAGEAGVPFFHTSGSEFEEMLVGAGASRVRDLFEKAKKASPALIFIDEVDAVGRKRGTTIQSSSTEQTLNQILVEMDGFEPRDNVIVIAATNRPDVLDPALLRPGRFDRKVVLDAPDIEGRKAILLIHAANKPIAEEVDFENVAKRTVGFSGADLENMLNEAAIIVAKENRTEITSADIEEAATKVQAGPIRKRKRTEEELRMTAYHEAAHAVVMKLTPQSDPVHRITILSRGMALGYTMPLPETDQLQTTRTKMKSKIRSLLAGFTAEEMVFGDVTTGASNDIERATEIAKKMVKSFGMSEKLGLVKYGNAEDEPHVGWGYGNDKDYSEDTAELIDNEIRQIIQEAHADARKILEENRGILDKLAELLLEKEVIEADEFKGLFKEAKKID